MSIPRSPSSSSFIGQASQKNRNESSSLSSGGSMRKLSSMTPNMSRSSSSSSKNTSVIANEFLPIPFIKITGIYNPLILFSISLKYEKFSKNKNTKLHFYKDTNGNSITLECDKDINISPNTTFDELDYPQDKNGLRFYYDENDKKVKFAYQEDMKQISELINYQKNPVWIFNKNSQTDKEYVFRDNIVTEPPNSTSHNSKAYVTMQIIMHKLLKVFLQHIPLTIIIPKIYPVIQKMNNNVIGTIIEHIPSIEAKPYFKNAINFFSTEQQIKKNIGFKFLLPNQTRLSPELNNIFRTRLRDSDILVPMKILHLIITSLPLPIRTANLYNIHLTNDTDKNLIFPSFERNVFRGLFGIAKSLNSIPLEEDYKMECLGKPLYEIIEKFKIREKIEQIQDVFVHNNYTNQLNQLEKHKNILLSRLQNAIKQAETFKAFDLLHLANPEDEYEAEVGYKL